MKVKNINHSLNTESSFSKVPQINKDKPKLVRN